MKTFTTKILIFLALSSLALDLDYALGASNYYVDTNHPLSSDNNPGTEELPWKTVQHAANVVQAGHTILVKTGTYPEKVNISKSGTAKNPIVFKAIGNVTVRRFGVNGASYVHITEFTVTNRKTVIGIYFGDNTSHCIAKNNTIYYVKEVGIEIHGQSHTVEGNEISHVLATDDADGIRFFGSDHNVKKNYIHDILYSETGTGAHVDGMQTWGPAKNIIFDSNFIHMPDDDQQGFMIEDLASNRVSNLTFINNVFVMNSQHYAPAAVLSEVHGFEFYNNTYVGVNKDIIVWAVNGANGILRNNIFYLSGNNRGGHYVRNNNSTIDMDYNLFYVKHGGYPSGKPPNDIWGEDPRFTNVEGYNFHLKTDSPAIDGGIFLTGVKTDIEGTARPIGAGYDIGAYEFRGNDTDPPNPPKNLRIIELSHSPS